MPGREATGSPYPCPQQVTPPESDLVSRCGAEDVKAMSSSILFGATSLVLVPGAHCIYISGVLVVLRCGLGLKLCGCNQGLGHHHRG